jgi:hypothetical protein
MTRRERKTQKIILTFMPRSQQLTEHCFVAVFGQPIQRRHPQDALATDSALGINKIAYKICMRLALRTPLRSLFYPSSAEAQDRSHQTLAAISTFHTIPTISVAL